MQFQFYKYQGTGNDFVLIDNRNLFFPKENVSMIKYICDRRLGVGADGLMLLENIDGYDFKMVYYNSDGNESSMCGNGGRCISAFAKQLGIVDNKGNFIAIDGLHEFIIENELVHLKMIDVSEVLRDNEAYVLFTGSPHYVCFRNEINKINLVPEARSIRYNNTYKQNGININFVEEQANIFSMRTYERGVEDETLSCGTGTVAVALSIAIKNNLPSGKIEINTLGGKLQVAYTKVDTTFINIWLIGAAKLVFKGSINVQ